MRGWPLALGAIGIIYAILRQRRQPAVSRTERVGALLTLAGGGLLGLLFLVSATQHAPLSPRFPLVVGVLIATGVLLLHWPAV